MHRRLRMRVLLLPCLLGSAASCTSSAELPDELVGEIEIVEYQGVSSWGGVRALFEEASSIEDDLANDGSCRVYRQPCLGQVGACGQEPGIEVGTVRIRGLWAPLDLEAGWENSYFAPDPPSDLFEAGATISVSADDVIASSLTATGVQPMESALAGEWLPPFGDEPVAFSWTPGSDGSRVRMHLNVASFCHAGADWLVLQCDSDDTGTLTVAESVLDALPPAYQGCGGMLTRYRSDEVVEDGRRISLFVGNADWFDLMDIR